MRQPLRGRGPVSEVGPDQIDVEVGLNMRRIRLIRGFSQTELGEALGLSFQQVQKYERGANRVSASMLVKAARFLRVRPSDLLPPEDEVENAPSFVPRLAEIRGVAEVINAYCAVQDPALRLAMLQFMRAVGPKGAAGAKARDVETAPGAR